MLQIAGNCETFRFVVFRLGRDRGRKGTVCYRLADFCRRCLAVKAAENQTEEFLGYVPYIYERLAIIFYRAISFRSKPDFSRKMRRVFTFQKQMIETFS